MGYFQVVRAFDFYAEHPWLEGNLRLIGGMLVLCSPSSNWVPSGNNGDLRAAKKGTSHPTILCRLPRISVLSNRRSPTHRIVYGADLYQPQ